jgi:hypothetical protein
MAKKNTIVLIVITAILVLALGIFLLFFTSPKTQTPIDNQSSNSPFGNYTGSSSTTPSSNTGLTTGGDASTQYINNPASPLIKISTVPIAGAEAFGRKVTSTTTTSIVRYIERATGHATEYDRSTYLISTVSNKTIPSVYKAWWSGDNVIAQFFLEQNKNIVKTFTGNLPSTISSTTQLTGSFLTDDIYTLAISPEGKRVFVLPQGDNAIGSISNLDGTKKTPILNFPFNEWAAQWPSENTITLTTKPSFNTSGYMYFLSTAGVMTKAIGNIAGLTTLTSPDLGYTIYSTSNNSGISTGIYNFKKNVVFAFNNGTLPEKCVWSKQNKTTAYCAVPTIIPIGNYPDDWYQGNISFVDNIYKVDLLLSAVQLIYKLPTNQSIDAINLFLDAKEENLYFTNKNDYYLWGLTVKGLTPINQ